ncbi:thiol:disulfide interchange protein TlpA [Xanthobacter sp. TB0139]|uniref:thiol:disulfide interchange protein TlpA n=1 Tax=Xanthobacter sp. TB0139 TaxID=3459178 RepID=UPI004039C1D8
MTSPDPDRMSGNAPSGAEESGPGAGARRNMRFAGLVALAMLAGATTGVLALYGMNRLSGNAQGRQNAPEPVEISGETDVSAEVCAGAPARAAALAPLVRGEIGKLQLATAGPRPLPPLSFTGPQGQIRSLADFRGRVVLLNLWATWCPSCREEMPALDRLQQKLGGPAFEVVTINLDRRDPAKPQAFFDDVGVRHLALNTDVSLGSFQALRRVGRAFGLPSTVLVDGRGCELGFLAGPAAWDDEEAVALLHAAIEAEKPEKRLAN